MDVHHIFDKVESNLKEIPRIVQVLYNNTKSSTISLQFSFMNDPWRTRQTII